MRKRFMITTLALAATQLGATDCGQITRDPGFDLWCGDSLCTWKVVRGDVRRVGTWHEGDSGVELVGEDAAIAQVTPVTSNDTHCIRFDLIADVEDTAEAFLDTDLEGDGTVDQHDRIPTSHYKPVSFHIFVKPPFDGIRFEINKRGTGRVVLAQIDAKTSDECEGLPMIDAGPRPNGASCLQSSDCESGLCTAAAIEAPPGSVFGAVCATCAYGDPTSTCGANQVCGYHDPISSILAGYSTCVPTASRELGEQCVANGECASNICSHGVCSACASSAMCGGLSCGPSWVTDGLHVGPDVCGPGTRSGSHGAPCGTDADCASGACNGAQRSECTDGRPCHDAFISCPVDSGLLPGACTTVGIQGGSCQ